MRDAGRLNFPAKAAVEVIADSPLGRLRLTFTLRGLAGLEFLGQGEREARGSQEGRPRELPTWAQALLEALREFFAGRTPDFSAIPLDLHGTPFQLQVWQELQKIPWGETVSYHDLASRLGKPKAARAVGRACGANPIPIIIPCHRVVAADGSLGGFSSGLEHKRWLLKHEGRKGQ